MQESNIDISRELPVNTPYEDAAFKIAMQYFGEVILPRLGVSGVVDTILPTEGIYLELKRMYEDFNYLMADGGIGHFEFQSRDGKNVDLKRFRIYEAVTSQKFDRPVTTYVVYSGRVKKPVTELTEGINTYRIIPIVLKGKNADKVFRKIRNKKTLSKKDLVPLLLTPLMSGTISVKDRVKDSFSILKESEQVLNTEDVHRMEAVLYALASKLLDRAELNEVKEAIRMTELGRMLWEDGALKTRIDLIKKKHRKKLDIKTIAQHAEESEDFVQTICKLIDANPALDAQALADKYQKSISK